MSRPRPRPRPKRSKHCAIGSVETRSFREATLDGGRAQTIDEDQRSVEAVLATETPVATFDWERYERVNEILLADGVEFPKSRQVPFLDTHTRSTVGNQLGSVREIARATGEVRGTLFFASTAEDAWAQVREGHITDVSVGYQVIKRVYVPADTTQKINGRDYTGPINVVTQWRLSEVSLVPIGADEQAKLRGLDPACLNVAPTGRTESRPAHERNRKMDPQLREELIARGMPADLDDEQAFAWLTSNRSKVFSPTAPATPPDTSAAGTPTGARSEEAHPLTAERVAQLIADGVAEASRRQAAERAAFRSEVTELCAMADVAVDARYLEMADLPAVRKAIIDDKAARAATVEPGLQISFGASQRDKHLACVGTALLMRAADSIGSTDQARERFIPQADRAAGWEQYRHARLMDMARTCLLIDGYDIRGRAEWEIAACALGFAEKVGMRSNSAFHTTGSFAKLTQDALRKSLARGYQEAPSTWRGPMKQGPSVPDFKTIHRLQVGAVPSLPIWQDNQAPTSASFKDAEETYAVEARSLKVSFSWQLLVNNDLGALADTPFKMGRAAARTVNALAWSIITANAAMRDGVALFSTATGNRKKANLITGAASLTVTTVGSMTKLMRLMTGENTPEENASDDILNIQPMYIVGPAALETTILQLVNSIADPAAGGNAGVFNTARYLTPIIEPILDSASSTAFFLFASPLDIETVEVTFLDGQETPVTRDDVDFDTLARRYIVLQTFGAKALDWRGIVKHAGA